MKNAAILLTGAVTLLVILVSGSVLLFPAQAVAPAVIVVPVHPDIANLEQTLADQEAVYRNQLANLETALDTQKARYQTEINTLTNRVAAAQQELAALKNTEQTLLTRLNQLQANRAARLMAYQAQLQQLRRDYLAKETELQNRLDQLEAGPAPENNQPQP